MTTSVPEDVAVNGRETVSPEVEAANFIHLYWDVVWYGITFGSTLSFLAVFATRLGAAGWQIGLLTAGPALINTLFTIPAGRWLEKRSLGPAVTWTAICHRLGFVLFIPLPLLLPQQLQVWAVLALVVMMAIPGTALVVGFNALLATTVPPRARAHVTGWRNALLAGTIMASFLLSGLILDHLTFEWGYAAVFALGAVGAGMSTYHLARVRAPQVPRFQMRPLRDRAQPGRVMGGLSDGLGHRLGLTARLWLGRRPVLAGWRGRISPQYWWAMAAYFVFHFSQMLPAPLFPIFWVREARLSDGLIGWINATFYLSMLVASPFLERLTRAMGNFRLTVWGALLLALYPLLTALSSGVGLLLVASVAGGVVWALLSGAMINRLMELAPEDDRPNHFAVYNLALNVATLSSTMLGPLLANMTGLREAIFVVFVLRVLAGLALARWG